MQCREISQLLFSKIKNSVHFGGFDSAMPSAWNNFGLQEINQMIRNLDFKNTGYVNWRTLLTNIILLRSTVPTAKEIARIEKAFKAQEVDCDTFCNLDFWFEETESSKDRENAIEFERVRMIKQLLWRTHASDDGLMIVGRFVTCLGQLSQRVAEGATFSDVLFA